MTYLALIFLLSSVSFAATEMDFLTIGDKSFKEEKQDKSKWVFNMGLDYIRYHSTFPKFNGKHETFYENEEEDVYGMGLGFGREILLGAGLSTTITVGTFYSKTINTEVGKAGEDVDLDIATTSRSHQILQYEASLSLNYLIENKILDIQPYVKNSVGAGSATIEKRYERKPVGGAANAEDYDIKTEETYIYTKFALGMNVISYKGLYSYFEVSTMLTSISERSTSGDTNAFGTTTVVRYDEEEKDLDETVSMTMAAIGLGYKF